MANKNNIKIELRTMKQIEKQLREINDKQEHIIFRLMDDDPRVCCGRKYCKNGLEENGSGNFKDI
jgi:hypothetical protein